MVVQSLPHAVTTADLGDEGRLGKRSTGPFDAGEDDAVVPQNARLAAIVELGARQGAEVSAPRIVVAVAAAVSAELHPLKAAKEFSK